MTTKIHIWKNSPADVGHVSMQVKDTYISFWPKGEAGAKGDIKLGEMHDSSASKSYRTDCRIEGKDADRTIDLNSLDEDKMISYWNQFIKNSAKYNMLKSNCSTVVASLLEEGSGVKAHNTPSIKITDYVNNQFMQWLLKLRFLGGHIHMWTPNDVETYALQIKSKKK